MNQTKRITTLQRFGTAIAFLGLVAAVPLAQADDDTKITSLKVNDPHTLAARQRARGTAKRTESGPNHFPARKRAFVLFITR
jgi:hypothetical protein